ncbi:hypothetical protein PC112_g22232 [Phytophthora cactorum]|nr:hypothetical protein PC112_g22232 [Phytophthora cactorum]KAG3147279.1 hypothetical protein PC128_g23820 [Phytophthora cactorum]
MDASSPKQNYFYHLDEVSRIIDHHKCTNRRRITDIENELPVHYFAMPYNRWKEASSRPPTYPSYETFYIDANQEFQSESEKSEVTHNVIVKPTLDAVSHWGMLDHLFGLRPMYSHDHVRDPITTDEDHG